MPSLKVNLKTYSLSYSRTLNPDGVSSVTLNDSFLSNNKIVLWENESIPQNVYRWKNSIQEVCVFNKDLYHYNRYHYGYIDPIYFSNSSWVETGYTIPVDERPTLDSIIYISGRENLTAVKDFVTNMINETSISQYNKEIESLRWQPSCP